MFLNQQIPTRKMVSKRIQKGQTETSMYSGNWKTEKDNFEM